MTDKRVPRERKHDDAPERIYLQVCDDADCKIPFDEHYEVTWARESITERSIEYVRADVACAERDALKAALRMVQELEAGRLPDEVFRAVDRALEMCGG